MKKYYFALILITALIFALFLRKPTLERTDFALDTFVTLTLYGGNEETLNEAFRLIHEYENIFSPTRAESALSKLNNTGLSDNEALYELISESIVYCGSTDGRFDITIAPVSDMWSLGYVPEKADIQNALTAVSYENITCETGTVFLENNVRVDLGAAAKGYIADRVIEYLVSRNIKVAIVNLGGDIYALGDRNFKIGVQKPFAPQGEIIGFFSANNTAVVTSGIAQRYFTADGVIYHHVIDALTGEPVNNGILSVTVLAPSALEADILATSAMILGLEQGTALIESAGAKGLFATENGLYFAGGAEDDFTIGDTQ